jgi:hypothetical protein
MTIWLAISGALAVLLLGLLVRLCTLRPAPDKHGGMYQPLVDPASGGEERRAAIAPEDAAGFFSRYTFWWVFPTLNTAIARGSLDAADLPRLPRLDSPALLFDKYLSQPASRKMGTLRLLLTLTYSIQPSVFMASLLHGWLFLLCMFLDPLLLQRLLQHSATDPGSVWYSLFLVTVLTLSMLVRVTCMECCFFQSVRVMNNARSTVVHAVYRKSIVHMPIGAHNQVVFLRKDCGRET